MKVSDIAEIEESKRAKVKSQNHVDHLFRYEGYRPQGVLAKELDDQSASLKKYPAMYASLSAHVETRVVAGKIVAALPGQCTYSQRPKYPAFPGPMEYHRIGTTSLYSDDAPSIFSSSHVQREHQEDPVFRHGARSVMVIGLGNGHGDTSSNPVRG